MTGTPGSAATQPVWVYAGAGEETYVEFLSGGGASQLGPSSASTSVGRIRGRFGAYIVPGVVDAVAATSRPVPMLTRRFFAGGEISASATLGPFWRLDHRGCSEEPGTLKQIEALNTLLSLPDAFSE